VVFALRGFHVEEGHLLVGQQFQRLVIVRHHLIRAHLSCQSHRCVFSNDPHETCGQFVSPGDARGRSGEGRNFAHCRRRIAIRDEFQYVFLHMNDQDRELLEARGQGVDEQLLHCRLECVEREELVNAIKEM